MATTPKWNALSIHERIRAMNETLDSVESSQGDEAAAPTRSTQEDDATPVKKRSSVVDIWRQREAKGESLSDTEERPQPPIRKEAVGMIDPFSANEQQLPRMARRSSRGVASASPAPPPLPMRRMPQPAEPELTIVPSPSNQSTASSGSAASRRSTRVLQAWERQAATKESTSSSSDVGNTEPKRTTLETNESSEPIIITESRRSVVDIWKHKATEPAKSWTKKTPPALPKSPKATTKSITKQPLPDLPSKSPKATPKPSETKESIPKWRAALKSSQPAVAEASVDQFEIETSTSNVSEHSSSNNNRWTQLRKVEQQTVPKWKVQLKPVASTPVSPRWTPPATKEHVRSVDAHSPVSPRWAPVITQPQTVTSPRWSPAGTKEQQSQRPSDSKEQQQQLPTSPRWSPASTKELQSQRSSDTKESQTQASSRWAAKEQRRSSPVANEKPQITPVAATQKPEEPEKAPIKQEELPTRKGSVLDRWKVAPASSPPVVPQWKRKSAKPPVEHVVVQDEPTASETEMPSDDELVDFTPQETTAEPAKEVTPKKPMKITDRWLQAKGVTTSKPPVWAKPVLKPVKTATTKAPKEETAEAVTIDTNEQETVAPAATHDEIKSEVVPSSPLSPRAMETSPDLQSKRRSVPRAIECESTQNDEEPSPLKIAPPSPIVSKLVKEFGHRTPVAGLRKIERTISHEEKKMDEVTALATEKNSKSETIVAISTSSVPSSPSENHTVPEHLTEVVKDLEAQTPSGKKRLSIADRWTAKVSASKTNSASKSDISIEEQPTDEEEADTTDDVQDSSAVVPKQIEMDVPDKSLADAKRGEDASKDALPTPSSARSGVADRWKKRLSSASEKTPEIPPRSPKTLEQTGTPQSSEKASPVCTPAKAKSPTNFLPSPRILAPTTPPNHSATRRSATKSSPNEEVSADNSSLLQKLSFSSDAQSNPETSDVEIVLNDSSAKDEASTTLRQPQDKPSVYEVEPLVCPEKEQKEVHAQGASKSSTTGARGRLLSRNRALLSSNRPTETKSAVGTTGHYPDFQRLVDRSRNVSSSLSPTPMGGTNSLPLSKSKPETSSSVTTPPRFQKALRSLSAPRSKPSSKVLDKMSTSSFDSSPIDMITAWNQKLHPTNATSSQPATFSKTTSPPRYVKKVKNAQDSSTLRRNRKNFAHLGRKHAAKRPQNAESHDEDSMEEELTLRLSNEDDRQPMRAESLSPDKYLSSRDVESASTLDSRRYSSTPIMSNRRSASSEGLDEDKFEHPSIDKRSETSISTRKLATEKSLIKKKLNSRRKSRENRGTTSAPGARPAAAASNVSYSYEANSSSFDQDQSYDHGEDYDAILLPDSGTPSSLALDQDYDQALETATSSASTPSSLANKAERLLQERRRKSKDPEPRLMGEPQPTYREDDMEEFANRVRQGIPSHDREMEQARRKVVRGSDDSSAHGVRSLSSRYNVSSRFMDQEGERSLASGSMRGAISNDEESSFMMSAASTNASPPLAPSEGRKSKQASTPKQRRSRQRPSDGSVASSVNTANMSAWDASRVSDIASLMSFDLKKFASAVDERVAVLRDFVGGPNADGESQFPPELDMEMEDVAIEVEYVEDDGEDMSNSPSDLGLVSSQSGDELMRKGFV